MSIVTEDRYSYNSVEASKPYSGIRIRTRHQIYIHKTKLRPPCLSALLAQPPQHLQETPGIHQLRASIDNLLPTQRARSAASARSACGSTTRSTRATRALGPVLQIAVLVHTTTADSENNRLAEPLPPLPETRLDAPAPATLLSGSIAFGAGGHGAAGVCAARVEIQEAFGLLQGRGGGVLGIHEGLGDLGESQVFVRWEEVFHPRDEGVEVGA
jgi:hypothetical protein